MRISLSLASVQWRVPWQQPGPGLLLRRDRGGVFELVALWATGQRPHYDVVYGGNDLEPLIERLAAVPHQIRDNPSVDREEH